MPDSMPEQMKQVLERLLMRRAAFAIGFLNYRDPGIRQSRVAVDDVGNKLRLLRGYRRHRERLVFVPRKRNCHRTVGMLANHAEDLPPPLLCACQRRERCHEAAIIDFSLYWCPGTYACQPGREGAIAGRLEWIVRQGESSVRC